MLDKIISTTPNGDLLNVSWYLNEEEYHLYSEQFGKAVSLMFYYNGPCEDDENYEFLYKLFNLLDIKPNKESFIQGITEIYDYYDDMDHNFWEGELNFIINSCLSEINLNF